MPKGPYRRYLKDVHSEIPRSTVHRWNKLLLTGRPQIQIEAQNENEVQRIDIEDPEIELDDSDVSSNHNSSTQDSMNEYNGDNEEFLHDENVPHPFRNAQHVPDAMANHSDILSDLIHTDNMIESDNDAENDPDDLESFDATVIDVSEDGTINAREELINIDQANNSQKVLLYEGCEITLDESVQLIMSYALRFHLSDIALEHLLFLINSHLPVDTHHSLHSFLKNFPLAPTISTHFFCAVDTCHRLVQFVNDDVVHCECGALCDKNFLQTNMCFFLHISLKEQLQLLLNNPNIRNNLRWIDDSQSDVISGNVYKKLMENGTISRHDITIQWNTDGVQLFKSSKIQLWPIQVSINELPYTLRKENILLCGLWYGPRKPNMNTFLQPFVEELNMLHNVGFQSVHDDLIQIKVHALVCSVDSMARPILQNIQMFRGAKGCSFCLHESQEYHVGRGNARIYRGDVQVLRTHTQHLTDCIEVMRSQTIINGIKGPSILLLLKPFDIISSFVPEYMHCVLLGVVKSMVDWWLDGANKDKPFYIGNNSKINVIDKILLSIKPPSEITRTPRSLHERKLWKASEWKHFLLYYSLVCLSVVEMPKRYIDHWFLLVYSINVFLQLRVSDEDFTKAKAALKKFVLSIETIYAAPQLMKFNFHLLLHIPKSVKDFGALWSVSAFPYEHYNSILAKMFRSSQAVPKQICKTYLRMQMLKATASEVFNKNQSSANIKALYAKLTCNKKTCSNSLQFGESLRLLGASQLLTLTLIQKTVIEYLMGESINNFNTRFFQRFIFQNVLYHVEGYQQMRKRKNCIVQLQNKEILSITHILMVNSLITNRSVCVLLGFKMHSTGESLCLDRDVNISSNSFLYITEQTNECVAISPNMLMKKCVMTPHPSNQRKFCCFPLANLLERD